jgi:hypothetical protein
VLRIKALRIVSVVGPTIAFRAATLVPQRFLFNRNYRASAQSFLEKTLGRRTLQIRKGVRMNWRRFWVVVFSLLISVALGASRV